jgi:site-specific recombinase XerD
MTDIILYNPSLGLTISAWLDAKSKRSGSAKTKNTYRDTLLDFRAALQSTGLDLDADPDVVSLAAQAWAGRSKTEGKELKPASYNQRLAVISSFYDYARKQRLIKTDNPIERIERRKVQEYGSAVALDAAEVKRRLKAIDRTTAEGKRDYALIGVALATGRRVSELAAMKRGDLLLSDGRITVTFPRCKGNKQMADTLSAALSKALLDYIGTDFAALPFEAPVWVSLSHRNAGKAVSGQTIADICERRLGVSKVHALRHTFAHEMESAGAKTSDIQARLGHESLATTGRYLSALKKADNPFADALSKAFGIGD